MRTSRTGLYGLMAATFVPWLWVAVSDLWAELRSAGETSDAPHHAAMGQVASVLLPIVGACLVATIVLAVRLRRDLALWERIRIGLWFGVILLMFAVPFPASMFSSRLKFNAFNGVFPAVLVLAPLVWMLRSRPKGSHAESPESPDPESPDRE